MALQADHMFKGINIPNAYLSVSSLGIADDKQSLHFTLDYRSAAGAVVLESVEFSGPYELEGINPFTQAYTYLKTLPEFGGLVDC